jgi:hypothetical protein
MKIRKISILLAVSLAAVIAFTGCKKDDGPIKKKISITDIPTITTNIDATGSQSINLLGLGAFNGKFKVDLYFPGTTPPTKVDIVVRKWNGPSANNNNVKVYKTGVTSLPATITVTAAEIATLFGTAITLGDNYDFAPDIYLGDKRYEAFPAIGTGTGAGLNGQPNFGEFARFAAICAYDPAIYQGNFLVVSDAWNDFSPGQTVTLTNISATQFSFLDPFATAPLKPVIVTVNTGNNQVSIARQSVGTHWAWAIGTYTGAFVGTAGAATSSFVAPCDKTLTLNLNYGIDGGLTFGGGPYLLVLKKP